jgi:hypothetical protein
MASLRDFIGDRARTCPHCGLTMMKSDYRGPCSLSAPCAPNIKMPTPEDWRFMYSKFCESKEGQSDGNKG